MLYVNVPFGLGCTANLILAYQENRKCVPRQIDASGALLVYLRAKLEMANIPMIIAVQSSIPWNRRGIATASTMFFRTIGGTFR